MIRVTVQGHDVYEQLRLPAVPHKGDRLWLSSLVGHSRVSRDVVVSKVEWARDQTARYTDREHEGIHVLLTVRRVPNTPQPATPPTDT